MNSLRKIVATGASGTHAQAISGDVATALVATGTNQATALALYADNNEFTTVASGTGTILSSLGVPGDEVFIANAGANALLVYPPVGMSINALSANAGFSIPAGGRAKLVVMTTTKAYALLSA